MGDVLSQNEIDALLSALSTGTVDADTLKEEETKKKVRIYDFKRPNKLSKEQINTLHVIYENFARSLATFLSGHLRSAVTMEIVSVEQVTYEEFIRSVSSTTIIDIFSMDPMEGSAIMEINPNLGFAFLDKVLGGPGGAPDKIRSLTEIEYTVIESLSQKMLDYLVEPWANIVEISPTMERIETNPQLTQLVSPTEVMIITSIETSMAGIVGYINICIPFILLEPIVKKLNVQYYYSTSGQGIHNEESFQAIQHELSNTKIPVSVLVGATGITVGELLELSVGDVVKLDRPVDTPWEIILGDHPKFVGKPGISNKKLSIQVTGLVKEDSK
jgi:flagellar motor switch protein FliM